MDPNENIGIKIETKLNHLFLKLESDMTTLNNNNQYGSEKYLVGVWFLKTQYDAASIIKEMTMLRIINH